jgi:hypothetical protein
MEDLNEGRIILEGESNPVSPEAVIVTKNVTTFSPAFPEG